MKTANILTKIKYILLTVALCLLSAFVFIIPFQTEKSADAANGLTFTAKTSVTEIKTNATDKEFIVYGEVSGNTIELFSAEFRINIDTSVFEFKEYMTPAQIATALNNPSLSNLLNSSEIVPNRDYANGKVTCYVDNNWQPLTLSSFVVGGYKIAVKEGATLSGSSDITVDKIVIPDYILGEAEEHTAVGTNMAVAFVEPSNACELTNLTSTQSGVTITKDGNDFKAEVAYSVSSLSTSSLKPTVSTGAAVTYSPTGSVNLNVGANSIKITVTAEDGKTTKAYTLTVTRAQPSTECDITGLTSSQTNVAISKGGDGFVASVPNSVSALDTGKLSATVSDGAKVSYSPNGNVPLEVGKTDITITITAEDGSTKKTATLTVTRAEAEPVDPVTPTRKELKVPTFAGGMVFTGAALDVTKYLNDFDSEYMNLNVQGDAEVLKADTYTVIISLKDPNTTCWAAASVAENTGAVKLSFAVSLADEENVDNKTVDVVVDQLKISVTDWVVVAGETPKFNGVPESAYQYIDFTFFTEDGTEVKVSDLVEGSNYTVKATAKEGFGSSILFTDEDGKPLDYATYEFTFEKAASWTDFFTQAFLGLAVWIWLVIAAAVLLFLILFIVLITRHNKKKKAEKEEERRREEERLDRLAAQNNNSNAGFGGYGMPMAPMMGGMMPMGMQQPVSTQPIVVGSASSDQISELKQELRDLRQELKSQPVQPAASESSEHLNDLKQELRDLRQDMKAQSSQPAAQPVQAIAQPAAQPVQTNSVPSAQEKEFADADHLKDEIKNELQEDFGHKERVEHLLETIAISREQDRQKIEQEEQERRERLQNMEARRKERVEASEYYHTPLDYVPRDPSAERIRELEGKLHSMEELIWMLRFGGMQQPQQIQQPQQAQIASAKDERVQELEAKLHEMEMKQENEKRFHEWETKQQELRFREMELNQREMRLREEEEKRFREMEDRLRYGYLPQATNVTVQPQPQKPDYRVQQNEPVAEKPVVVVQQPVPQSVPHTAHPTVQPGSVMTTTTTTTIDATKDAKVDDLPDYSSRFTSRRRS